MRGCGAVELLVFILVFGPGVLLGSSSVVLDPPRTSYPLNSPGRPLTRFTGAQNTTTLLLSDDGSTLYVGARDAVLSLDVSRPGVIALKNKVEWKPSEAEMNECSLKGRNKKAECGNFVKVLQAINSTHLYACGSFAYNPQDMLINMFRHVRYDIVKLDPQLTPDPAARGKSISLESAFQETFASADAETLSMVRTSASSTKRCPYSPFQRNTAITINGELFSGTTTDFKGQRPAIARHFSQDGRPDVTLDTSIVLLNEPTFVSSWFDAAEGKVLFFFSEVAKEHSFVEELTMPRVAQVCKSDVGGEKILVRSWTSFAKAPLLCQTPRELPFNVLQDITTLQPAGGADTLFYGIFTSQWSIGPGSSAVCVFKMRDIRAAFDGGYKREDMRTRQWNPVERKQELGKCGLRNASGEVLEEVKKSFLTSGSVRQAQGGPLLVSTGRRYSRLVVERTRAADGNTYTMLFLLTENGFLHKVVLSEQGPRVIEEVQVFQHPQLLKLHPPMNLILSSSKGVVYVGSSEGVTAVPLSSCPSYQSCAQCVLARDPLCGWDHNRTLCTQVTAGPSGTSIGQDVENGNVTEVCVSAKAAAPPEERHVCLMDIVTLPCPKPSNLATLRWIAPRSSAPSQKLLLLLQRADGSLSFPVTADALGAYACVSEEGGYEDQVASYSVKLRASARAVAPPMTAPPMTAPPMAPPPTAVPLKDDGGGIMSANSATVQRKTVDTDTSAQRKTVDTDTRAQRKTVDTDTRAQRKAVAAPTATKTSAITETSIEEEVAFVPDATTDAPRERSPPVEERGRPTDLLAATTTTTTTTTTTAPAANELYYYRTADDGPMTTERGRRRDTTVVDAFVPTSTDVKLERSPPPAGHGRRQASGSQDPVPPIEFHRSTETIRDNVDDGPTNAVPTAAIVCRYTEDGRLAILDDPDRSEEEEEEELRERVTKTEDRRFNQLVVVSFLLAVCVCVLLVGLVHRWRQSHHMWLVPARGAAARRSEKGGGLDSPESIPSLSEEDSPPEVTVIAQSDTSFGPRIKK